MNPYGKNPRTHILKRNNPRKLKSNYNKELDIMIV
jgi:hypothetical protein